jgi:hypothetical protein
MIRLSTRSLRNILAAGAAALTLGLALAPAAEARPWRHHGWHGHHHHWGWRHPRPWYPAAIGVGYYGGACFVRRARVYDPVIDRYVIVRRTVCG